MADLLTPAAARLVARAPDAPVGVLGDGQAGKILAAALTLFAERGFYGTSIRDIARAVGLQSASLYGHFQSKEEILAQLVLAGHEEHHRRLREALAAQSADAAAQLEAWVHAHVEVHAEYPVLTVVANNELHALPDGLAKPALALRHASELLLVDIIERGTRAGAFDPPQVWMAVAAIGGMGIRVATWYDPGIGITPDEVAATYAEMALLIVRSKRRSRRTTDRGEASTDEILRRRGIKRQRRR